MPDHAMSAGCGSVALLDRYKRAHPERVKFERAEFDYGFSMASVVHITAPNGREYLNGVKWLASDGMDAAHGFTTLAQPNKRRLKKWLRNER